MGGAETLAAARAFASPAWVAAHLLGAFGLAAFAWLALRASAVVRGRLAQHARWTGLLGAALVLPYYGAETFALHVIGRTALAGDLGVLTLVEQVRSQPAALTSFGIGLLLLATSGVLLALAWQRSGRGWLVWPLGAMVALVLPQYYLPPTGRIAFGLLYAATAALAALAVTWDTRIRRWGAPVAP